MGRARKYLDFEKCCKLVNFLFVLQTSASIQPRASLLLGVSSGKFFTMFIRSSSTVPPSTGEGSCNSRASKVRRSSGAQKLWVRAKHFFEGARAAILQWLG